MSLIEKYKPQSWEDHVFPSPYTRSTIETYATGICSDPLLIWGGPGNGKSTMGELVILSREGSLDSCIKFDCTVEMTAAQLKRKFMESCARVGFGESGNRYILLDEFDWLSPRNQKAFGKLMDEAPKSTIVIGTTNDKRRLDNSLLTRFTSVCFDHPNSLAMEAYAKRIALAECIAISDADIEAICKSVSGNFRMMLKELERYNNVLRLKSSVKPKKSA